MRVQHISGKLPWHIATIAHFGKVLESSVQLAFAVTPALELLLSKVPVHSAVQATGILGNSARNKDDS